MRRKTKLPMNQKANKVKIQGNHLAPGKERAFFNYYFFKMLIGLQFSSSLPETARGVMKSKPQTNH